MWGRVLRLLVCLCCMVLFADIARAGNLSDYYDLKKPAGNGPFPAIVMVAACGGYGGFVAADYERWTNQFVAAGFVVVRVEFLKTRSLSICATFRPYFHYFVTKKEAVADIYQTIADLQKNRFVDASRISLVGQSFGGGAVLQAMAGNDTSRAKIHSVVAYYPECHELDPWAGSTPTLILHGSADNATPWSDCVAVMAKMANSSSIRTIEYSGAMHGFDFSAFPRAPGFRTEFGQMAYDPTAAGQSWNAALAFLKQ